MIITFQNDNAKFPKHLQKETVTFKFDFGDAVNNAKKVKEVTQNLLAFSERGYKIFLAINYILGDPFKAMDEFGRYGLLEHIDSFKKRKLEELGVPVECVNLEEFGRHLIIKHKITATPWGYLYIL